MYVFNKYRTRGVPPMDRLHLQTRLREPLPRPSGRPILSGRGQDHIRLSGRAELGRAYPRTRRRHSTELTYGSRTGDGLFRRAVPQA